MCVFGKGGKHTCVFVGKGGKRGKRQSQLNSKQSITHLSRMQIMPNLAMNINREKLKHANLHLAFSWKHGFSHKVVL